MGHVRGISVEPIKRCFLVGHMRGGVAERPIKMGYTRGIVVDPMEML